MFVQSAIAWSKACWNFLAPWGLILYTLRVAIVRSLKVLGQLLFFCGKFPFGPSSPLAYHHSTQGGFSTCMLNNWLINFEIFISKIKYFQKKKSSFSFTKKLLILLLFYFFWEVVFEIFNIFKSNVIFLPRLLQCTMVLLYLGLYYHT